jgi:hypothetical protein
MEFLCEYTVDRKKEGLYRFVKPAIIAAWFIVPIILIIIGFAIGGAFGNLGGLAYASAFIIPPLTAAMAKFFASSTTAFGDVAYEYTIAMGEMSFAKIYGDRYRREWFSLKVSDMEKCAPYDMTAQSELDGQGFDRIYKAASSVNAPYLYYAIFTNAKGERCLMYFEVIKKSLKMIKTYFPSAVMTNLPA